MRRKTLKIDGVKDVNEELPTQGNPPDEEPLLTTTQTEREGDGTYWLILPNGRRSHTLSGLLGPMWMSVPDAAPAGTGS